MVAVLEDLALLAVGRGSPCTIIAAGTEGVEGEPGVLAPGLALITVPGIATHLDGALACIVMPGCK